MAIICPTVLATDLHSYREQLERIEPFAQRIQVDLADGTFAPVKTVALTQTWWDESIRADLHLMYQDPTGYIDDIVRMRPNLVIVHAEADGSFVDFAHKIHQHGIKVGVALLPQTPTNIILPAIDHIDHALIFSGSLGHFGGQANLNLLQKASELKMLKPQIEVGWDGGVNANNAKQLVEGGVDVLNVGGAIQKSDNPTEAYRELQKIIEDKV